MRTFKIICLMVLGAIVVMGLIGSVIGVASAVNYITFGGSIESRKPLILLDNSF